MQLFRLQGPRQPHRQCLRRAVGGLRKQALEALKPKAKPRALTLKVRTLEDKILAKLSASVLNKVAWPSGGKFLPAAP